jgi:ATP-binding cassette subfamily B protein
MGPLMNNSAHMQYAVVAIAGAAVMIMGHSGILPLNWFTGMLDIGTIAAFLQYTRSFSQPISMMSQQATSILNALAGAERIFAIIDEQPEVDEGVYSLVNAYDAKDKDGKTKLVQSYACTGEWAWKNQADSSLRHLEGDVVFDHVTFGYVPEKTVLHDICIHAKPGMKIALVGSTGSGKTTTINLLSRFYDVEEGSGTITYDGIPLNDISKSALRKSLGMVQQNTHLFTGTIKDNIRYGNLEASDAQVYEAAKLANADYQLEGRDLKIKELETRCNELFLQTCEQAEKIKELEEDNKALQMSYNILKDNDEKIIKEMGEQIEKMKCCGNCKNEGDYKEPYRYGTGWCNICKRHKVAKGNFDKWEIKEK